MKIACLISGGVDSSVALRLLLDSKVDKSSITAFYIKIWLEDELSFLGNCPWKEDLEYVEKVCDQLGVNLKVVSLQKEYWQEVVDYTIKEVKLGRTPNPDILCNQKIKFGKFFEVAEEDFDYIVTGHYAQVEKDITGKTNLLLSKDPIKDQTYFLAHLSQQQISKAIFPIGKFHKYEVREIAAKYDLANKLRKDSQGICFLGKLNFRDFLKFHLGSKLGKIVEIETGKIMGQHEGFWFYTIGQRQGIGLSHGPWYVVSKDIENNIVYISNKYYETDKIRTNFQVNNLNWINNSININDEIFVKMRHGPKLTKCKISYDSNNIINVNLDENDQGIAAGQFAVFYKQNICIGSGVIK